MSKIPHTLNEAFNANVISRVSGETPNSKEVISLGTAVWVIQEGTDGSVIKEMGKYIPKNILANVLGTDISNLTKIYKKRLTRNQTININDLSTLWEQLNSFFNRDHETINQWISESIPALDGNSPSEMMGSAFGRQKIREFLDVMKFGDFA